jgi:hypothetical protein
LQPFEIVLHRLELVPCGEQVLVHDFRQPLFDRGELLGAEPFDIRPVVQNVVCGLRPRMIEDGLNLNFASQPAKFSIFRERQPFVCQGDEVVNGEIQVLGRPIRPDRVVDFRPVEIDLEVFELVAN